ARYGFATHGSQFNSFLRRFSRTPRQRGASAERDAERVPVKVGAPGVKRGRAAAARTSLRAFAESSVGRYRNPAIPLQSSGTSSLDLRVRLTATMGVLRSTSSHSHSSSGCVANSSYSQTTTSGAHERVDSTTPCTPTTPTVQTSSFSKNRAMWLARYSWRATQTTYNGLKISASVVNLHNDAASAATPKVGPVTAVCRSGYKKEKGG